MKKCGNCKLLRNNFCLIKRIQNPSSTCEYYCESIEYCDICRNLIPSSLLVYSEGKILCGDCASKIGTCAFCVFGTNCAYNEDSSGTPKFIVTEDRPIPMKVKNPTLIQKCCANCFCGEGNNCNKELYGTCANYKERT